MRSFGSSFQATLVTLLLLPSILAAIGPIATINVVNRDIQPDGFRRGAVLGNGVFPGPLLRGMKGDRFQVNVVNSLHDKTMAVDTTVHWHGIFQKGSNWADGISKVTQCPIVPGYSFKYDFKVPDQAGTFWWHSHYTNQYCDGLRGPMVVYDPQDPHKHLYDVDNEHTVITLADWHHIKSPERKFEPHDSILINGKGRSKDGPLLPLSVVNVIRGRRYRFRLVAMSCDANFVFSIDQHQLTVIEADGINTRPLKVDSIQIFAGQRYSFILDASKRVDNYRIRALPNRGAQGFDGGINSAILRYLGARQVNPWTPYMPSRNPLMESSLVPLENPAVPGRPEIGGADVALNIKITLDPNTGKFLLNGASFNPPTVPVLLQILNGTRDANELLPKGSVFPLPRNKVVEVSVPGTSGPSSHPFHLHGHDFHVVRSAGSSTYNYVNPIRRDTVNTGVSGDNVTLRFMTDNAGPWFLHCHIDHHLSSGMAIVFAEDIENVAVENPPQAWKDLCPIYESSNGSN